LVERANGSKTSLIAQVSDSAALGVALQSLTMQQFVDKGLMEIETKSYSLIESIPVGIDRGVTTLGSYVKQLKKIFNPETGAYKGVGGFAAIGGFIPRCMGLASLLGHYRFIVCDIGLYEYSSNTRFRRWSCVVFTLRNDLWSQAFGQVFRVRSDGRILYFNGTFTVC
jgi:hypothetical protein